VVTNILLYDMNNVIFSNIMVSL